MLLCALLVQPACVLYTRMVMRYAAAGAARVLATTTREDTARAYARRRLRAVPEASLFHTGGPDDWQVTTERADDGKQAVVEIVGHLRPLPFLGAVATLLGEREGSDMVVRVRLAERVRPTWIDGTYDAWVTW